jgi:hypothetical protein
MDREQINNIKISMALISSIEHLTDKFSFHYIEEKDHLHIIVDV